ncbi:MAG TPA: hypothetical protein DD850_10415 [Erwinia persicina]|uniref:Uncharacterized protein n=1 Tax=Erwinia persicina TaxID=55211 RepID=A0A4U3FDL5_9GAMM|nr:hypothetical protein EpCFBP13511_07985 [Erwinia persicina]HBH66392.1 hypothetical protein [Erwinia persicina]HBI07114.1 hypothetical protein [Erwinia persicina]HBQ79686.1 hypothetical protein [Erwinia persicina]HBT14515.1 hypothetical protein [Erwinia persicina]
METVFVQKGSYPSFLWISTLVILFIVGGNPGKTVGSGLFTGTKCNKKTRVIMLLLVFSPDK